MKAPNRKSPLNTNIDKKNKKKQKRRYGHGKDIYLTSLIPYGDVD